MIYFPSKLNSKNTLSALPFKRDITINAYVGVEKKKEKQSPCNGKK